MAADANINSRWRRQWAFLVHLLVPSQLGHAGLDTANELGNDLEFTGERFMPGLGGGIEAEHLHRYAAIVDAVRGKSVIDIACGEGYGSAHLANAAASVLGVDIDEASIDEAKKQYDIANLKFQVGSCTHIPVDDASVDVVVSFETIEHIVDQDEFLVEIKRVLRPGGFAFISTPDKRVYSDQPNYKNPYHLKEFYEDEYIAFLKKRFANIQIVKQQFVAASLIVRSDCGTQQTAQLFEHSGSGVQTYDGYKDATYVIAVVGDHELPSVSQSMLMVPGPSGFYLWNVENRLKSHDETIRQLRDHNLSLDAVIQRKSNSVKESIVERDKLSAELRLANKSLQDVVTERDTLLAKSENSLGELSKSSRETDTLLADAASCELALRATNHVLRKKLEVMVSQFSPKIIRVARKLDSAWQLLKNKVAPVRHDKAGNVEDLELIKSSGMFDTHFYVNRFPDVALSSMEPALHYLLYGAAEGRDPHPLFDSAHYISQCPELAASQANPLLHYLRGGCDSFDPNPLFSTSYYQRQLKEPKPNALMHYLEEGARLGINPSILFDTRFYLESNPDVAKAKINPLSHYLLVGAYEGRKPHPLFDPHYYFSGTQNTFLAKFPLDDDDIVPLVERFYTHCYLICEGHPKPPRANPLLHFLSTGRKNARETHPLFSTKFYAKQYQDVQSFNGHLLLHYLHNGRKDMRQPHPLFEPAYYLGQYPQLLDASVDLLVHFVTKGWLENAKPNPHFDSAFYTKTYPDVSAAGENPLVHYITKGAKEKRLPNPTFDPQFYVTNFADVAVSGFDPLTHYVCYGVAESRPQNLLEFERKKLRRLRQVLPVENTVAKDAPIAFRATDEPEVSIIIPIYGQLDYTLKCLRALSSHVSKLKFEIIVVDDKSPDNSFEVLSEIPGLRLIQAEKNGGFVLSCNLGSSIARGKYLVFLNNDTEVMAGWLDELVGTFDVHPNAGLVGSQLLYPNGRLQEAGGIIYQDGSAANFGRDDDFTKPEYNYVRSVDYCSGASIAISRELFFEVGRFDTHYVPAYAEDVDLAFQVRKIGRDVLYQPLSRVVHMEGISSGTDTNNGVKAYQITNLAKIKERWAEEIATHPRKGSAPYFEHDRSTVRRALIVDSFTPKPDQDAGSALTFEWIQNLKSWGYHCTYVPMQNFRHEGKYTTDLQRIGVKCIYPPHFKTSVKYLETLADEYDLILIFRITVFSRYIEAIKHVCPSAKVLFHTIDLHYLRYEREAQLEPTPANRLRAVEWKEKELSAIRQSDCSILVSPVEEEVVRKDLPGANIEVIPLSARLSPLSRPFSERKDILFIGGFAHPPNIGAVEYFVEEVFPLVKAKLPGIRFFVLGAHPPKRVLKLAGFDVIVTGHVEDLTEYFGHCRLSVAPLQVGAGMKGKVLSSLAFGLPCVATPVAAEGIGLLDGRNILIGTSREELAEQIVTLYTDSALWSFISSNGLSFIRDNYSLEENKERLALVLRELGLPVATESGKASVVTA